MKKRTVIQKKSLAVIMAAATAVGFAPMLPAMEKADAAETGSAEITISASSINKANQFDLTARTIQVSGDTAENYGYTDNGDTSKVTFLDAVVAAQAAKYGSKFSKDTASNYLVCGEDGWVSKWFGVETSNVSYLINNQASSTTAFDTIVKDDDVVSIFGYQDTASYSDYYTQFTKSKVTAYTGQTVRLTLKGMSPFGTWSTDKKAVTNGKNGTVCAAVVGTDGTLTSIKGGEPDAQGKIQVKFNKTGTYGVSASGKASVTSGEESALAPITLPYCQVTVKKLGTPSVKAKAVSWTSAKISWKKATNADKYVVYRASSKHGSYKKIASVKSLSYTDKGLKTGKTYFYKVAAKHGSAKGAFSNIVSVKAAPSGPSSVKASGSKNIRLSWSSVKGADGYAVSRASAKSGKYKVVKKVTAKTSSCTIKTSGKKQYFKVRAYKKVSGKKVYSKYSKAVKYAEK